MGRIRVSVGSRERLEDELDRLRSRLGQLEPRCLISKEAADLAREIDQIVDELKSLRETSVAIPFPERTYRVDVTITRNRHGRYSFAMKPDRPVPFRRDDSSHGLSFSQPTDDIELAIRTFYQDIMRDRVRYEGAGWVPVVKAESKSDN